MKQFCETLQKWNVECRADGLVPMRFAVFPLHLSKVLRLPRKRDAMLYELLHLSRKIIFPKLKIWCSKMQPLSGNQRPDLLTALMNMSLVLPLPREMHLPYPLHMSHTCHQFWNCYKTLTFCSLLTRCLIPCACHANDTWTSKSAPYPSVFCTFDLEMCFAPQRRALFRHLNFQKWSEHEVVCTCLLGNVLRATTACTFSTAQLLNVLGSWSVLYILTWNVLRTTTACNFSSLIWPHRSRTSRFSEPTCRPSGATNHWKNTVFRDFPTFSRTWIFFLRRLSLFDLLSSSLLFSDSSHLCFSSVHIVGSLTSKLPSIINLFRSNSKLPNTKYVPPVFRYQALETSKEPQTYCRDL